MNKVISINNDVITFDDGSTLELRNGGDLI